MTVLNIYIEPVHGLFGLKADHDVINKSRREGCQRSMVFLYMGGGNIEYKNILNSLEISPRCHQPGGILKYLIICSFHFFLHRESR